MNQIIKIKSLFKYQSFFPQKNYDDNLHPLFFSALNLLIDLAIQPKVFKNNPSICFYYFLEEFQGMFLFCFRFIAMSQINNKNQEQFGFRYFPIIFFGKNNLYPKKLNRNCLPYFIFLFFSILNNRGLGEVATDYFTPARYYFMPSDRGGRGTSQRQNIPGKVDTFYYLSYWKTHFFYDLNFSQGKRIRYADMSNSTSRPS